MKRLTVQEAVEAVEKGLVAKNPFSLRHFISERNYDIEEDFDTFFKKVSEAVNRRNEEGVRAIFRSLEAPLPPELEEGLRKGNWVHLEYKDEKEGLIGKLEMTTGDENNLEEAEKKLPVPLFDYWDVGKFSLNTFGGTMRFRTSSGLELMKGKAYLEAFSRRDVERALNVARKFHSFLSVMDLPDLEGAIETLAELSPGESRIEGDYVLARSDKWLLRRGLAFGDPALDKAFLLGEPITLSFPGDVEISFRTAWKGRVILENLRIRWGEEEVTFRNSYFPTSVFDDNPVAQAIKDGLRPEVASFEKGWNLCGMDQDPSEVSPKMWAFLKAFVYHEDPLKALAEGSFYAHVTGELFLRL
jgi:hypothetical protein